MPHLLRHECAEDAWYGADGTYQNGNITVWACFGCGETHEYACGGEYRRAFPEVPEVFLPEGRDPLADPEGGHGQEEIVGDLPIAVKMLAMSPIAVDCTSRFLPHNAAVSARSIALNPNARTDAHMDAGKSAIHPALITSMPRPMTSDVNVVWSLVQGRYTCCTLAPTASTTSS